MERQVRMTVNYETMVNSARKIAQQTLDYSPVIRCRLMHELRQLVYCVGNIWSCQKRYWRLPTMVLYSTGSSRAVPECNVSVGLVARGVVIGFASVM